MFGDVNPSAKLPVTFPTSLLQVPAASPLRWPGVPGHSEYSEGLAVGYRWYDQNDLTPLFPFGYGLSYTTFTLANLTVAPQASNDGLATVEVDVTNTGARAGSEVVQLYLSHPAEAGEPPNLLRGFRKVTLEPGETKRLGFQLDGRAMSIWDTKRHRWVARAGAYTFRVGRSSRDLPLDEAFTLTTTFDTGDPTPPPPTAAPFDPSGVLRDAIMCPKDLIAPSVNGILSVTGFPPVEVLGRPVP